MGLEANKTIKLESTSQLGYFLRVTKKVCVCVCVCVRARACMRVCVYCLVDSYKVWYIKDSAMYLMFP